MKCSESLAVPAGVGDVHTGCGESTPFLMMRSLPFFSATRIVLASTNAMLNGWNKPVATALTRILPPCTAITCGAEASGDGGGAGGGAGRGGAKPVVATEQIDAARIDAMKRDLSVTVGESYHLRCGPAQIASSSSAVRGPQTIWKDRPRLCISRGLL